MEDSCSTSEGKTLDIKQEAVDKYDFDSGSQDSSKSGGSSGCQRWAPNLNGIRKSAFMPYKPIHSITALTNLQRGNTQARVPDLLTPDCSLHEKAGRGELSREDMDVFQYVNVKDEHGLTALHWAACYGQLGSCQDLVTYGAELNTSGPNGETALHLAAAGGHNEVVKFLLSKGANPNLQDDFGTTPLMYAAAADFPYTCNELLAHRADLTVIDLYDQTAYSLATRNQSKLAQTVIENFLITCLSRN